MRTRGIIFLFLQVLGFAFSAQTGRLEGFIVGANSDTLAGATVRVNNTIGTVTSSDGHYLLEAPEGNYSVVCSMTGYATIKKTTGITAGTSTRLDFTLSENTNPLDEIVISAERYEQKLGE